MISNISNKKICINITTYKPETLQDHYVMNEKNNKTSFKPNKFFCAICLNTKQANKNGEYNTKLNKSCPICQKSCDYCQNTFKRNKEDKGKDIAMNEQNVKNIQTSETDVSNGLNLLNEVLTVFQNKKVDINDKSKPTKDVGVSTEDSKKEQSKLTISSFNYSIDDKTHENGKFTIVCSCQPNFKRKSFLSMDLTKHKSCSIPQMKIEELKYSLKEKSRSKDAIEEVNRMFATVRRSGKTFDNANRPMIRNGPRVLPVVKTLVRQETEQMNCEMEGILCKCCQTCLSSGDSLIKPEYCHEEQSNKPSYMTCCHYQQRNLRSSIICEHCQNVTNKHYCDHSTGTGDVI